jgi:hypothetical protein
LTDRKYLSKRVRFEVFKRDGFTCRYCGRQPPDVVLHCDHITAVANGGSDDTENLVTSCADCNLGKGAIPLGKTQPSVDTELTRLEIEQELGEVRLLQEKRRELEEAIDGATGDLSTLWCDGFRSSYAPYEDIMEWVKRYGAEETHYAITHAFWKRSETDTHGRKCYVGAILRNRDRGDECQ